MEQEQPEGLEVGWSDSWLPGFRPKPRSVEVEYRNSKFFIAPLGESRRSRRGPQSVPLCDFLLPGSGQPAATLSCSILRPAQAHELEPGFYAGLVQDMPDVGLDRRQGDFELARNFPGGAAAQNQVGELGLPP